MKLWSGMLSGNLDKTAEEFNSSIKIDKRMVYEDIEASIAHVQMLCYKEILNKKDSQKIIDGLKKIKKCLEEGKLDIDLSFEDIHSFVEFKLIEEIGEAGKKMHTARSRNDQVTTDLKLYLRKETYKISGLLANYLNAIIHLAENNLSTIMPGYTHLQAAQPISFAHHILSYAFMGLRDIDRLNDYKKRLNELPLGACALAGTTYNIDRKYTAKLLGFDKVMENSIDAVSDRDYILELQSILSIIGIHLSRLAEELIIWSSQPFNFVIIDDKYSTGSSIMPQKKNPDMAELIRAKTGRLIGNMNQSFIMLKGLPLAYSKDMQEDKESIFDSVDTIKISLTVMTGMLAELKINKEKMLNACKDGYINATDLADYLTSKKVPFRDAHHIAARLVKKAKSENKTLEELDLGCYKEESEKFEKDVYEFINLENIVEKRSSRGGPAKSEVKKQIDFIKENLIMISI